MTSNRARTKIVATIGPASNSPADIKRLIQAGVDVFRLNFSHGDFAAHGKALSLVRSISKGLGSPVAVLQDLCGPKIRLGEFKNGEASLVPGKRFILESEKILGNAERASINHSDLWKDVQPGQRILLADGVRELKVLQTEPGRVYTQVIVGGIISDRKGVNLPDTQISISALTDRDRECLAWGLEHDVDYVAMSFVRSADDLAPAREMMSAAGKKIPLIAKIEKPEAIANLDAILDAADGVMIARGDLGVEMPPEKVPALQKMIIRKANERDALVITATQMLESMIQNPRPTRAEASDVANAIYDRTDAVMLSGETAVGDYPVEAVEMMDRIALETESENYTPPISSSHPSRRRSELEWITSHAAAEAAKEDRVKAICAFTVSGFTARLISKCRPPKPIYAVTPDEKTYRHMALVWGVQPIHVPPVDNFESILQIVNQTFCGDLGFQPGDAIVVVCGLPLPVHGTTNTVRLHVLESVASTQRA